MMICVRLEWNHQMPSDESSARLSGHTIHIGPAPENNTDEIIMIERKQRGKSLEQIQTQKSKKGNDTSEIHELFKFDS
jgi:hypothetical protein